MHNSIVFVVYTLIEKYVQENEENLLFKITSVSVIKQSSGDQAEWASIALVPSNGIFEFSCLWQSYCSLLLLENATLTRLQSMILTFKTFHCYRGKVVTFDYQVKYHPRGAL